MRDVPPCCVSDDALAELPRKDGFRLRGVEMTRIETFTDAAFAFALTLLVISIDQIPSSVTELLTALKGVPAFCGSAALLMMFWYAHHAWSRRFGLEDGMTVLLSTALVVTMLIYVYPLKFMFNCFLAWISRGRLNTGVTLRSAQDLHTIFVVYGIGFAVMSGLIVALNAHGLRRRADLRLNRVEVFLAGAEMRAYTALATTGLVSCALAVILPPSQFGWPGWVYASLPIMMPVLGRRAAQRLENLRNGAD